MKRGIRFDQGRDKDIMQGVQVGEVMLKEPLTIYKNQPLTELYRQFQETNLLGFPVLDDNGALWGIGTLQDLEKALSQESVGLPSLKVEDLATVDPLTVFPDEPIWTAIEKMAPIEFRLKNGHYAVGKRLMELELSTFINVVSLDRESVLHIPRGGTCFDAGDIITLFGRKNFLGPTRERFLSGKEEKK